MKKLVILFLVIMSTVSLNAQKLVVYSLMGKVELIQSGSAHRVQLRDVITMNSVINIPFRGCIVLYDAKNMKQYTLKSPGRATVASMISNGSNSIKELTSDYVAFISRQISNGGHSVVRNCSEPATVTRELSVLPPTGMSAEDDLIVCGDADYKSLFRNNKSNYAESRSAFNEEFDAFVREARNEYDSFRKKVNREYAEFVRQAWKSFESKPAVEKPKDDEIKPTPAPIPTITTPRNNGIEKVKMPIKDVVQPLEIKFDQKVLPIVPITPNQEVSTGFKFTCFGTQLSVRVGEEQKFTLKSCSENDIADALVMLSKKTYDNVLYDLLEIKKERNLSDWAYYQMLVGFGDTFLGHQTNESTLMTAYLMQQSGYKIRLGRADNTLYLLLNTAHLIYGYRYFDLPEGHFYMMTGNVSNLSICNVAFTGEKPVSLLVPEIQRFDLKPDETRRLVSKNYTGVEIEFTTNTNLIDFFNTYPSSEINNNKMTRWAMYANTPIDNYVTAQIYPQLNTLLSQSSEVEKVAKILDLCQTGLVYEYDNKVWGHDRVFFAEETLHYPFADCEDRSILFTRLVRDIVGLDCILIYYPGHLAAGVCFNTKEVSGDAYEVEGRDFVVCDPTYINASIGMSMPSMRNKPADVTLLKN